MTKAAILRCLTCNNLAGRTHVQCGRCRRENRTLPKNGGMVVKATEPLCPKCCAAMLEKINRKDGSRFLGCSRFPDCRGSRPIEKKQPPPPRHEQVVIVDTCSRCGGAAPKLFDGLCAFCFSKSIASR